MVLYLSIIAIAMVLISVFNIAFYLPQLGSPFWLVIVLVCVGVAIEFAIDGLLAIIIEKLPNKWFDINKKIFTVPRYERKLLDMFQIRKWKDKVWDLGGLGGFSKKTLADPNNKDYIERFLIESNKGLIIHWANNIMGFLIIVIFPLKYALTISLPIAIVNFILSTMSIMVLRYNTPKLIALHKRLSK